MTAVVLKMPRREPERAQKPLAPQLWLWRELQEERSRFVLWLPVFLGIGIGLYFALPAEPPIIACLALGALVIGPALLLPPSVRPLIVAPLIAAWIGCLAGAVRTDLVAAPVLARDLSYTGVTGTVRWREPLDGGRLRLVIDVRKIEHLAPKLTPRRVRISLRGVKTWPEIGDVVEVKAALSPPSGPIAPGAYDYSRIAWFAGIGAVGYGGSALRILVPATRNGAGIARWFAALRVRIETRIDAVLAPREAGVATALVVGARGGISQADTKAMQNAGVSHVLSISGLHLALVAGLIFLLVRDGLALIEPLALRFPLKKIAAVVALLGAAFYVGMSDGSAPVIRSFIMFAVAIFAVLIDRPALSMRTVALAAAILLLASPESLLDPSFEMSFGAVIGFVAFFEWWAARSRTREAKERSRWLIPARYVASVGLTSVIAELSTAPFAAFHFNQFQIYGLVANEVVVPLLGFFIMPLGALAVVAMPFHLEHWPLVAMGWGIDQMLATAHWTASLPGAVQYLTAWPAYALLLMVAGGLWLVLWRRPWRLAGIPVALVGLCLALAAPAADAFVGEGGTALAFRIRSNSGWEYGLLGARVSGYRGASWLKRLGADPAQPLAGSGLVRCDALGCIVPAGRRGGEISLVKDGRALEEECHSAKVIVSQVRVEGACATPEILLDPARLKSAAALRWDRGGVSAQAAAKDLRPWHRHAASAGDED